MMQSQVIYDDLDVYMNLSVRPDCIRQGEWQADGMKWMNLVSIKNRYNH